MARHHPSRQQQAAQALLASTAARLMAEDGVSDFAEAKKKAARQLGLPANITLPSDNEIATELRIYNALYQQEHHQHLLAMRKEALLWLERLAPFQPYLSGSVADGNITEYSDIDIQLFPDSAKEVEIFLLNRQIDFVHEEPRNDKAEAVLVLDGETADINLVIYPAALERVSLKHRDGRPRERLKRDKLAQLISESEEHAS